jgi:hypothetical protein
MLTSYLGDHKALVLRDVEKDSRGWIVDAALGPGTVSCRECGETSNSPQQLYPPAMGFAGARSDVAVENPTEPLALSQCRLQTQDFLPALEPALSR